MSRPIILVTGANAGLGLGVCERLLVQLSNPVPPDTALLDDPRRDAAGTPYHARDGCTLLLACRNQAKAREAVAQLERLVERLRDVDDATLAHAATPAQWPAASSSAVHAPQSALRARFETQRGAPYDERVADARRAYREQFCRGTTIETLPLDLASLESTRACAAAVAAKVPYLTHVVLNAGGAAWLGVNWLLATWGILTNLHRAVTYPTYKLQRVGDVSDDGLGWVWQVNVGAHYLLAHELEPLLRRSPYAAPSRIIWTGSLEANARAYAADDMQCLDARVSPHPYESTKYQCELLALAMDAHYRAEGGEHAPRVYTAHPGIIATSIFSGVIPAVMMLMMKLVFYLARWTGSPHHPIDAYKGAVAATYVALAPTEHLDPTRRYGAQCSWTGHEYVHAAELDARGADAPPATQAARLREACDATLRLPNP